MGVLAPQRFNMYVLASYSVIERAPLLGKKIKGRS